MEPHPTQHNINVSVFSLILCNKIISLSQVYIFMFIYLFVKQPYNERHNVQSDGHYRKITPFGKIQIRSHY